MPAVEVRFFMDERGCAPVVEWLRKLRLRDHSVFRKIRVRIQRLAELGHELRRPESDSIGGGLHELRTRMGHVNYRILYFFHGREMVVLVHAFTKEERLPLQDVRRGLEWKSMFEAHPEQHMCSEGRSDGQDA